MSTKKQPQAKTVEAITYEEATRKNIPTAEYQSMVEEEQQAYHRVTFERRNKDLDPQLVWRGKDITDWSDLVVQAPPLYIQEKVHPKVLIDDLMRHTKEGDYASGKIMADLFSDFNGLPHGVDKTEFYQHEQHWSNRMILGDSLQVMASLAEREGLSGKVQCIYFDPPYGIKFNSNFQWSTTSRTVTDGKADQITREPEQVKAFRDTWREGIHSYLTYLRDRLTVARDLLNESGSIFVQIGDENVHRVRSLMDEVFGDRNFLGLISFKKTGGESSGFLGSTVDYIVWFAKEREKTKYRTLLTEKIPGQEGAIEYDNLELRDGTIRKLTPEEISNPSLLPKDAKVFATWPIVSPGFSEENSKPISVTYKNKEVILKCPVNRHWSVGIEGTKKLWKFGRLLPKEGNRIYKRYLNDFKYTALSNTWLDSRGELGMTYVVQTSARIIQRCLLMTTDPGDLVLDPTCGSGTTAFVSEQWGRRWIVIDTSRVAMALARARIMGSRFPFYCLADSVEGQLKEAEITGRAPSSHSVHSNIRHGFVNERVRHITQSSITNNTEIDIIYEDWQAKLDLLLKSLNSTLNLHLHEWEIPLEPNFDWPEKAKTLLGDWHKIKNQMQLEIDKSIAKNADFEYLFDKPFEDKGKVRVAGPFTVESLSPHRFLNLNENDDLIDPNKQQRDQDYKGFAEMILENLKTSGVQQAHKEDKVNFSSLAPWPGRMICADGRYMEGEKEKRAAIFIGPEFGTVQRIDLVEAAREAADANFDVLIACAFSYEAHATDFSKLGRIPVLKARMNADLHMSDNLKNTGKGNLFVIFGEPDIEILPAKDGKVQVKINGVDVFHPSTGEVRSDRADGIACWFIDTDYNEESFFVRHAYFLGAKDPYESLQTSLKAEINKEAWESIHSDTSRPFPKPQSGRIAVKVINHLGDEVMKVFKI